ncbi:MAG: UDP-N-acetylmuramoylalanine--D-glutamate ligase [Armatimonadota bacterium]|nr:MAG: UDP-N-acetylmuramoylalanine--D-glutamate ligase [Armatimonadota bacterium]
MSALPGNRLLVLGYGVSGRAVAEAARQIGCSIHVYDDVFGTDGKAAPADLVGTAVALEDLSTLPIDFCVASPGIPPMHSALQMLRRRKVPVIGEIELGSLLCRAPVAAITGTNGKSTTTVLAGRMLQASGRRCFIGGNLSAEGYDLPFVTAVMQAGPEDVIVAEVSSFQLELCFTFRPRVAAFLNISEDHLNRYSSVEEYAEAKMRIFQAQTAEDFAVIGVDCPLVRRLADRISCRKLGFSALDEVREGAFLRGDELVLRLEGREEVFARTGETALWAPYDRLNLLAAACVAAAMGATPEGIRQAALSFKGLPHRLEDCGMAGGVRWINSSMCTNPEAGAEAARAVAGRFPLVLIAGGAQKECGYADWGRIVAECARSVILVGRDRNVLRNALEDAGRRDALEARSLAEAMEIARAAARPGDAVLLAPAMASFDEFSDFRHRGRVFREIVERYRREAEP